MCEEYAAVASVGSRGSRGSCSMCSAEEVVEIQEVDLRSEEAGAGVASSMELVRMPKRGPVPPNPLAPPTVCQF